MPVVQNLYQIFKLPATLLVQNNCSIPSYKVSTGLKEGNVVSIGDNLVFQQLRYLHGDFRDHRELFSYISKLRSNVHYYKKQGQFKEAHVLEQRISEVLFVKDIVNVIIDGKKSDFHQFRTKGFDLNGIHYTYLCSGSGQIRRNTATFINSEYHDQIVKILNCGLDTKTSEFVLAKYSAYFALSFSSILWVRTPRVCVIKDFYNILKNEPVDFISHDENGKSFIEERHMDIELNCADGQGLIDPSFAKLWAEDMDLPFLPCSFVARSCFIKGNLATFDFREYAHTHGIFTIRDKWGHEYDIDSIDVLLSESQFKTHKYYSSWEEYQSFAQSGNIHWGVARYNKREDDEYVLANYQYIQALTLSQDQIHALIQPTVDWIQNICSGDLLYTLLYVFGKKAAESSTPMSAYSTLYGSAQTAPMKAIVKNADFLNDPYIQRKIYKNIAETINHAKLGKIWIRGNYQFMIADPLAQCQSALGLPVTGLLHKDEIYSYFWKTRFSPAVTNPTVDACRSPMIDQHEHNPMTVITNNPEADYWYQYLPSGIIYNIYDTSCARHSDSDYDGDIVLTTDNPYFISGSHKDHNVITYEKGLATPEKMTIANITKTVMKGFGTGVGGFSNTATCLYAMAAQFNNPAHQDQYNELMLRIKLLREIVGQEIDRIKGADKPSLPKEWKTPQKILPTDTQDQIIAKLKLNSMVVSKKPYFFRYLYPKLNQRFKQFEASYNQISRDLFGIKFKKLLKKPDAERTEEERNLIRRYQRYSPLINSPCTMNFLCKEFENVDFDIKFAKTPTSSTTLPSFADLYDPLFSQEKLDLVKALYKDYTAQIQLKHLDNLFRDDQYYLQSSEYRDIRSTVHAEIISSLQDRLPDITTSPKEFLYYCHKIAATTPTFNWGFAWELIPDQIIKLIPIGRSYCPVFDPTGEYTYLGHTYSLKDLTPDSEEEQSSISDFFDSDGQTPDDHPFTPDTKMLQRIIEQQQLQQQQFDETEQQEDD